MQFEKRPSGLIVPGDIPKAKGRFIGVILRDGKVIDEFESENIVVNEGLDYALSVALCNGPQQANWYLGLFQGNYAPVATDKATTIVANANEYTGYSNSSRPAYASSEANQSTTNGASPATFNFNAGGTVYGAFLISSSGKGAGSGVLYAASQFATQKTIGAGDQLGLTYVTGLASS